MTSRTINGMIKFQKSLNGMGLLSEVLYAGNNLADVNSPLQARLNLGLIGTINTGTSGYLHITSPFDGTSSEVISLDASSNAIANTIIACDSNGNVNLGNYSLFTTNINATNTIFSTNLAVTGNSQTNTLYAFSNITSGNTIECKSLKSYDSIDISNNISAYSLEVSNVINCQDMLASNSIQCTYLQSDIGILSPEMDCTSILNANVINVSNTLSATTISCNSINSNVINVSNTLSATIISCNNMNVSTNLKCTLINASFGNVSSLNSTTLNATTIRVTNIAVTGVISTFSLTNNGYSFDLNNKSLLNVKGIICSSNINGTGANLSNTLNCTNFTPYVAGNNINFNNNNVANINNLTCTYLSTTNANCNSINTVTGTYSGTLYCSTFDSPSSNLPVQTGAVYDIGFNTNNLKNISNVACTNVLCNTVNATSVSTNTVTATSGTYSGTMYCSLFDWPSNTGTTSTDISKNLNNFIDFNGNSVTNIGSLGINASTLCGPIHTTSIGGYIPNFSPLYVSSDLTINSGWKLTGNASGSSNLNASNISSGVIPVARLLTQLQCRVLYTPPQNTTASYIANIQPYISYVVAVNARTYRFGVSYKYRTGDTNVMLEAASIYNYGTDKTMTTTVYIEIYAVNGIYPLQASSIAVVGTIDTPQYNITLPVSMLTTLVDNTIYWIALSDITSNNSTHSYIINLPLVTVYYI